MIGIVIKSFSRNLITRDKLTEWDICLSPFKPGKSITREEAEQYIKENNLVKVVDNVNGVIWDTEDQQFLKKFKGCLKRISGSKATSFSKYWL